VLRVRDLGCFGSREVSILTGPGGPVLLPTYVAGDGDYIVSILTGPGGPVLHKTVPQTVLDLEFQSSPGPEARCYTRRRPVRVRVSMFQSSPGPEARCYSSCLVTRGSTYVSILTGPGGPVLPPPCPGGSRTPTSFNPHRARRPGATWE